MSLFPVYVQGMVDVIGPPPISIEFYRDLSTPPVRRTQPNVGPSWFGVAEIPLITATPSNFDFFQPLSCPPVRTKANVGPSSFFGQPPRITVTPSKWDFYQQLSTPPVRIRANVGPATVLGFQPIPVSTPSTWDWYQPLSVPPQRTKANAGSAIFNALQPAPPPSFGFYQQLSTGTLLNAKTNPALLQGPAPVFVPATVVPPPPDDTPLYAIATFTMNRGMMRG